jgi:BirA family biotin operon repressor/biotin-[acetyl-CoA-carboxylase] ligase
MGIGVNVKPNASMAIIDQPWTDLESELGRSVERNDLAARLINCLCEVVGLFEHDGLTPFLDEWKSLDAYQGKSVELQLPDKRIQGIVRGIDDTGALLLAHDGEVRPYQSGEVSMRTIPV